MIQYPFVFHANGKAVAGTGGNLVNAIRQPGHGFRQWGLIMSSKTTFESIVLRAFATIVSDYGYRLVESDDSYVRLDSDKSSIQVHYDWRRSFEVGVTFNELDDGETVQRIPFNLREVFREFEVPDADSACSYQSPEMSTIRGHLERTGNSLGRYCQRVIGGDHDAFVSLGERRTREAAAYTQRIQIDSVRQQAADAWRGKRFAEFVELLREFKSDLSSVDQEKLDYAMKRSAGY